MLNNIKSIIMKNLIKLIVLVIALQLFTINFLFATNYYIDSVSGNDSNNGTSVSTPWLTVSNIDSITFQPGDSILFHAGQSWDGAIHPKGSGTVNSPIVIGKYGSGDRPALNGLGQRNGTMEDSITKYATIILHNQSYWTIRDLEITNYNSSEESGKTLAQWEADNVTNYVNVNKPSQYDNTSTHSKKCAILVEANDAGELKHLHFINLEIHGVNGWVETGNFSKNNGGIFMKIFKFLETDTATWFDDVLVEDCHFHDLDKVGFSNASDYDVRTATTNTNWTPSYNVVFKNNTVERTAGEGAILRVAEKPLIESNKFSYCALKTTGVGVFVFNTDSALFQYNEACYTKYNVGDFDASGLDSDFKTKYTIVQYNYSHDNDFGLLMTGGPVAWNGFNINTVVRYNIIEDEGILKDSTDGAWSFKISGNATDALIHNNVFYVSSNKQYNSFIYHKNWGGEPSGTKYYNNIFYNKGSNSLFDISASSGNTFSNNVYYGNSFTDVPADPNKYVFNPLFLNPGGGENGYTLQPGSPAFFKGYVLNSFPETDYYGNSIPGFGPIDLGANQVSQGVTELDTIFASEDAYVRGGTYSNSNYGTDTTLLVKTSSNVSYTRKSILKFDLSTLQNSVETARLYFYGSAQSAMDVSLHKIADNSWLEDSVSYSTLPTFLSDIGTIKINTTDSWYSLDVTQYVTNQLLSDSLVSFGIVELNTLDKLATIRSSEASLKPFLEITVGAHKNIGVLEDAFVRGGLYSNTNYGSDSSLIVKSSTYSDFTRKSVLKFDLSNYDGAIDSAKIFVYGKADSSVDLDIHSILDDTWKEDSVTFNGLPDFVTSIGTLNLNVTEKWYEFDITSRAILEQDYDGVLSIGLSESSALDKLCTFYSKERVIGNTLKPYLKIFPSSSDTTEVISVNKDAHIRGGSYANTNYGSNTTLVVKEDSTSTSFTRKSLLNFDLSSLSGKNVSSAFLYFSGKIIDGSGFTLDIYKTVDSWGETTVTWNNQPTQDSIITSISISESEYMEYGLDITSYVKDELDDDEEVSFIIKDDQQSADRFDIRSKESGVDIPYLIVKYNGNLNKSARIANVIAMPTEQEADISLRVYPNPVNQILHIANGENFENAVIFSSSGRMMKKLVLTNRQIDVSDLLTGIYILQLEGKEGVSNVKFIKSSSY